MSTTIDTEDIITCPKLVSSGNPMETPLSCCQRFYKKGPFVDVRVLNYDSGLFSSYWMSLQEALELYPNLTFTKDSDDEYTSAD